MLIKHTIFYLAFFSLISLSTISLANYKDCNSHFNKTYIPHVFNEYNNSFSQKKLPYNLTLKYINQDKKKTTNSELTASLPSADKNQEKSANWKTAIWGKPFSNRVYGGMWTRHLHQRKSHVNNNQLMACCYNGIYLGTFINSHGDRTYSLGAQRLWYNRQFSQCEVEIGCRLGGMYGYKKHLRLYDTPFFPLIQIIADISINNVITQISWAWEIFTIGFGYKF